MAVVRYLLVGVINTIVGLGTIYFAMYFLGFRADRANGLGYSVGIIVSFLLNKKWTFKSYDHLLYSFLRFLTVVSIAYTVNLTVVLCSINEFGINPYVAQALGIVPYATVGYLGSCYFAFQKKSNLRF